MLKIESTTVINRPVEEVFAVLSNLENNPKWASVFLEVKKTSEGPIGVGTTWRVVQKAFGRQIESEVEVAEYEPNRKCAQKSKSGPFPVEVLQTYEPVEGAHGSVSPWRQSRAASSSWRSRSWCARSSEISKPISPT